MALDHNKYLNLWLAIYKAGEPLPNDSPVAAVTRAIVTGPRFVLIGIHHLTGDENRSKSNPPDLRLPHRAIVTGPRFVLIGIHHLTGDENRSKSNLYCLVRDINGKRLPERIEWGWLGQRPTEHPGLVSLDKPDNEPDGNISIGSRQIVWAQVWSKASDAIANVTTILPDEIEPGGEKWNTIGHHSHLAAWVFDDGNTAPVPAPTPGDCAELNNAYVATLKEVDDLRHRLLTIEGIAKGV